MDLKLRTSSFDNGINPFAAKSFESIQTLDVVHEAPAI